MRCSAPEQMSPRANIVWFIALLMLSSGCGQNDQATVGSNGQPTPAPASPTGTGMVEGVVDGVPAFGSVKNALWIGDANLSITTVLYIFSKPVNCDEIAEAGWDTRIPAGSQVLNVHILGTSEGAYELSGNIAPRGKLAYRVVEKTLTKQATSGFIHLTAINNGKDVTGDFDAMFDSSPMRGTFDAAYCADGVEP